MPVTSIYPPLLGQAIQRMGITPLTAHQQEVLRGLDALESGMVMDGTHFGMPVLVDEAGERFVLPPACPPGRNPLLRMESVDPTRKHRGDEERASALWTAHDDLIA